MAASRLTSSAARHRTPARNSCSWSLLVRPGMMCSQYIDQIGLRTETAEFCPRHERRAQPVGGAIERMLLTSLCRTATAEIVAHSGVPSWSSAAHWSGVFNYVAAVA